LEHLDRNPEELAPELESRITAEDQAEWDRGSVEDWVLEVLVFSCHYSTYSWTG